MNFNDLSMRLAASSFLNPPVKEFMLYQAGLQNRFHLGAKDMPGLLLIDATAEEVLAYVLKQPCTLSHR